ncbi:MAG: guanylate kinase [Candidatus Eisenbacteria bacterium]|nr:guanylate kinase [Candidatus Eisenbacteria bacterium]
MSSPRPFPVVISAPSGTGKTTVVSRLARQHPELFHVSVSATTRARRGNEVDGVHYHFVTQEEFTRLIDAGLLLEWALVFGRHYGTPRREIDGAASQGKITLLDIDVQGGTQVLASVPGAVSVFLLPPSMDDLRGRLEARRTEGAETIASRLREASREIEQGIAAYDYVVVNDDLDACVGTVWAIIQAERARTWRLRAPCGSVEGVNEAWCFQSMM